MSRHKVNFDAIREGARALLRSWPDEPPGPSSIPPRVHRVLWEDDYWRGVTMMGEACRRAFQAEVDDVGSRAEGAMAIVEMHRRQKSICAAVGAGPEPEESCWNEDQLTVLNSCWKNLSARGCIDFATADERFLDPEAEHDVLEEA